MRSAAGASVVAALSLALAGCAGPQGSGTPAQRVTAWMTATDAGASIGGLDVDSRNVDLALSRHDSSGPMQTVCLLLATDAQKAIGNLTTPDPRLTNDLNTAYTTAFNAGEDCYNAFHGAQDAATLLKRSAAERTKLPAQLAVAVDRATALLGHVPSTTTTTASPDNGDPFS